MFFQIVLYLLHFFTLVFYCLSIFCLVDRILYMGYSVVCMVRSGWFFQLFLSFLLAFGWWVNKDRAETCSCCKLPIQPIKNSCVRQQVPRTHILPNYCKTHNGDDAHKKLLHSFHSTIICIKSLLINQHNAIMLPKDAELNQPN